MDRETTDNAMTQLGFELFASLRVTKFARVSNDLRLGTRLANSVIGPRKPRLAKIFYRPNLEGPSAATHLAQRWAAEIIVFGGTAGPELACRIKSLPEVENDAFHLLLGVG